MLGRNLDSISSALLGSSTARLIALTGVVALASTACGDSGSSTSTAGTGSGGASATTTGTGPGATTSTNASGTTTATSSGTATGSTTGTSSTSGSSTTSTTSGSGSSTSSTSTGGGCDLTPILGSWTVTSYSCANGTPTALPPGFSFDATVSGNPANPDGQFVQNNFNACVVTNTGKLTCDAPYMGLPVFNTEPNGAPMCAPANCLMNNQCSQTPQPIYYTYQVATQNGMTVMTTVTLPNTPLTTCTSQGKQNPITFYWKKM